MTGNPSNAVSSNRTTIRKPIAGLRDDGRPSKGGNSVKLSVHDFNFWYGEKQALRDVNFEIYANKITALIGPSGCGKSTLIKVFNRLQDLEPSARHTGTVLYDGMDIYGEDVDVLELRKRIGMVFQKPNPFPKSIYENVAFAPRIHGLRDRRKLDEIVEDCLKQAALWSEVKNDLNKPALKLSGGQQQRVCIARTLSIKPDVILMDEPTSALDPIGTSHIEDLVQSLKKNYTIVIVTHNMQQAARVSDYTAVFLTGGEFVEYQKTRHLFERPKDPRTEDYITGKMG